MEKQLLESYVNLKKEVEAAEDRAKYLRGEMDKAMLNLIDHLQDNGKDATARYDGLGYVMMVKPRVYASIAEGKETALFAYLRKHKRADLIRPTIHPKTLSSYVKELMDAGEKIPESVTYYLKPSVRYIGGE